MTPDPEAAGLPVAAEVYVGMTDIPPPFAVAGIYGTPEAAALEFIASY